MRLCYSCTGIYILADLDVKSYQQQSKPSLADISMFQTQSTKTMLKILTNKFPE